MALLGFNLAQPRVLGGCIVALCFGLVGCTSNTFVAPRPPQNDTPDVASDETDRPPVFTRAVVDAGEDSAAPGTEQSGTARAFVQQTICAEGYDSDVSVDPAGKWVVFASTRDSERTRIYLQQVDGTAVVQLTSDNADAANPVFSPDGRRIAFGSTRSGSWQIYLMDLDGRNVVQVTSGPTQAVHPSFSPDGGRIVYAGRSPREGHWELWTADLSTGEKQLLGPGLSPTWSPDRSLDRIAFQRPRQRGSHMYTLWTLQLENGEPRRVTEVVVSESAAVVSPSWSPDGRKLAFATISSAPGESRKRPLNDIWTADADGSNRRRLTDGVGANLTPFWSGDGRVYFISDRGGNESVWSVSARSTSGVPRAKHVEQTMLGASSASGEAN